MCYNSGYSKEQQMYFEKLGEICADVLKGIPLQEATSKQDMEPTEFLRALLIDIREVNFPVYQRVLKKVFDSEDFKNALDYALFIGFLKNSFETQSIFEVYLQYAKDYFGMEYVREEVMPWLRQQYPTANHLISHAWDTVMEDK